MKVILLFLFITIILYIITILNPKHPSVEHYSGGSNGISSSNKRSSTIVMPFSIIKSKKKYGGRKIRNIGLSKVIVEDRNFFRPALIPLTPLTSPYLPNPPTKLPNFICYNPEFMSVPEDQKDQCGSCWAFSICYMLADRAMMYTDAQLKQKNLSAQQLLSCFNYPDGCDGESPEFVLEWMAQNKVLLALNEKYPYTQEDSSDITKKCPPKQKTGIGVKLGSVMSLVKYIDEEDTNIIDDKNRQKLISNNVENMKRELYLNGPFYCAMTVYQDLYAFTGGEVYKRKQLSPLVGGHAVEIVGYCDQYVDIREEYKDSYWIVKNTWGLDWPRNGFLPGYFCIKMGTNMCGIESRCGSAVPNVTRKKRTKQIRFTNNKRFLNSLKLNGY